MPDLDDEPTPENPRYSMFPSGQLVTDRERGIAGATRLFSINVDEGWRSWILCTGMYEWAASQLMSRLAAAPAEWIHPAEPAPADPPADGS